MVWHSVRKTNSVFQSHTADWAWSTESHCVTKQMYYKCTRAFLTLGQELPNVQCFLKSMVISDKYIHIFLYMSKQQCYIRYMHFFLNNNHMSKLKYSKRLILWHKKQTVFTDILGCGSETTLPKRQSPFRLSDYWKVQTIRGSVCW